MIFQNIKMKENIFLENIEYFTKGDLKGYINCILSDYRKSSGLSYEILFRVHDPENGKDLSLVSCDYGYMLHDNSIINDAEEKLKELCRNHIVNIIINMKWYETFDYITHKMFWWTQRNKNGICFEIRENKGKFNLMSDDKIISIHNTLHDAMNAKWLY